MKKCPMTLEWIGGTALKGDITAGGPCIGADCAAYMERDQKYRPEYGGASIEPCNEWSCAMMPREVWHSGREANE